MPTKVGEPTAYEYLVAIVMKVNTDICMIWPFYANKQGYGQLPLPRSGGKQQQVFAHRLAYKIVYGEWPMPKGLHSCDNPRCFNPRHVFPGTPKDNSDDMLAKDRQAKGNAINTCILTAALVEQARREYASGLTCGQLAARYGVSTHAISTALSGDTWKHVPNPVKMRLARKVLATQCLHGHPFVEGNLYMRLLPSGATHRQCKICTKNRREMRRLKLKEVSNVAH